MLSTCAKFLWQALARLGTDLEQDLHKREAGRLCRDADELQYHTNDHKIEFSIGSNGHTNSHNHLHSNKAYFVGIIHARYGMQHM